MLVKNYKKGNPFIGDLWVVDQSIFLNNTKQVFVQSSTNSEASGHNAHFRFKQVIKSAIGEWIERQSVSHDPYKKTKYLTSFHLITGQKYKIEKNKIFFNSEEFFTDSCGLASHVNSIDAVYSAFLEFFERQSLIYNWLTKSAGQWVRTDAIANNEVHFLIGKLKGFIDELFVFDISLHKNIPVILVLGVGEYYKTIGLKAGFRFEDAVKGALEEAIQTFGRKWTKANVNMYAEYVVNGNDGLYKSHYNRISPKKMKEEYSYLWGGQSFNIKLIEQTGQTKKVSEIIKTVSEDLSLSPYGVYIPTFYNGFSSKIIKVFSPTGYPHMYPEKFTEEESRLRFNKDQSQFPNQNRMIPFP
ncbi:YcaO-like family protein [Paenibacillus alvei]|uniref:YcaO-like family protein n=1 Tax=Paenibacillus alvei TaxID=44250 RepID=UPI002281A294|nr:YcaO-like family protein [Paenibacillus alvei]MCY7486885.1 YcaO-like family protein [Paenibacillus alvei]